MAGEISRGIGLLRVNAEGDTPSALVHALFEAASRKEVARAERLLHRAFPVISISLPLLQLHCLTQLADHVLSHLCVGGDRALDYGAGAAKRRSGSAGSAAFSRWMSAAVWLPPNH